MAWPSSLRLWLFRKLAPYALAWERKVRARTIANNLNMAIMAEKSLPMELPAMSTTSERHERSRRAAPQPIDTAELELIRLNLERRNRILEHLVPGGARQVVE